MRRTFISSLLAAGVIAAVASTVWAEEMHMHHHGAASGTPEAPLDIVRDPSDLPPPVAGDGPRTVKVGLQTTEVTGKLADGASYHYWTFNGKVPGPFIRVRVNDTVEVSLSNNADSNEIHSVDLHAVPRRAVPRPARRRASASRRCGRGSMSITAPRRWRRGTSPMACMA